MAKSSRDVDEEVVRRLKIRAARHDRSAAAEHREMLRSDLSGELDQALVEVAGRLRWLTRRRNHTPAEQLQRDSRTSGKGDVLQRCDGAIVAPPSRRC
jgi:antitoxin FitA